jgi:dATP pyrophosphohydrolase
LDGNSTAKYRQPVSVLVVVYTDDGLALLLKRVNPIEMWQSITGSLEPGEAHADAAARELAEETGFKNEGVLDSAGVSRRFEIDPRWQHRFAPGVVHNTEHEWRYRLPSAIPIVLSATEHSEYCWMPIKEAADKVWSWTNREALQSLANNAGKHHL